MSSKQNYKKSPVLFFFNVIITEYLVRPNHHKITPTLMVLINCPYRPSSRIAQWSTGENRKGRFLDIKSRSMWIDKYKISLACVVLEYLFFARTRNVGYKVLGLLSSPVFFGSSVRHPSNFWVDYSRID